MNVEDGINLNDVVNELDYSFADTTDMARIVDTHISDFNIVED
jgi:(2Fe-2S) ferredoxin